MKRITQDRANWTDSEHPTLTPGQCDVQARVRIDAQLAVPLC